MEFPAFIVAAMGLAWQYKYALVFLGMIIEGPIVMVASGFFLRFGVFDLIPIYIVLVIGDLMADIMWYYVGYYYAEPLIRKRGHFLGVTPEVFEKVKRLLHNHQTLILLGTKVTIGFGLALGTVITAGAVKVPFKKYVILNLIGEMVLSAILLTVGYYSGHFYSAIGKGFREVFLVAGFIFIAAVIFGFAKYMKSKVLKV
jgi:membrane protein DedA with SNARE-associated domain